MGTEIGLRFKPQIWRWFPGAFRACSVSVRLGLVLCVCVCVVSLVGWFRACSVAVCVQPCWGLLGCVVFLFYLVGWFCVCSTFLASAVVLLFLFNLLGVD